MSLRKKLEANKTRLEQDFGELQRRLDELDVERNNIRVEQTRCQGEYRLLKRLLDECLPERVGLPPFNPPLGATQAGVSKEGKRGK